MNCAYKTDGFRNTFSTALRDRMPWTDASTGATVYVDPFPCCVLSNFLSDDTLLSQLEDELKAETFHQKSNDLYKFWQSDDLRECRGAAISGLRDFLVSDLRDWMQDMTGISLTEQVDATCSKYSSTDTLLCHDDELEGRRIAFIFYLVPGWTESDGGSLDLFSVDEHGQPNKVTKSLVPKWNSIVFFEVSPVSFHQVAEVLSTEKIRMSISGWFYGQPFDYPHPYLEPPADLVIPRKALLDILFDCVNPRYFDLDVQGEIQRQFEEESSLELEEFLLEEVYTAAVREIEASARDAWKLKGPANKRNYEELNCFVGCRTIEKLTLLFQSELMFLLLSQLTGLELSDGSCVERNGEDVCCDRSSDLHVCDGSDPATGSPPIRLGPCCVVCVKRWSHGSYTLVRDTDRTDTFSLDASLFMVKRDWVSDYGGYVSYVAKDEDEELLTVVPKPNALALVYRDKETLKFVKHINSSAPSSGFCEYFELSALYWE